MSLCRNFPDCGLKGFCLHSKTCRYDYSCVVAEVTTQQQDHNNPLGPYKPTNTATLSPEALSPKALDGSSVLLEQLEHDVSLFAIS